MDFVDEEDDARLKAGQELHELVRPLQHGGHGRVERRPEFRGDRVGKRGLAQARRAAEERS